jgi:hypothetical protein
MTVFSHPGSKEPTGLRMDMADLPLVICDVAELNQPFLNWSSTPRTPGFLPNCP